MTVDDAVSVLRNEWLSAEDLTWIRSNEKEHVVATLHPPFGTGVRNAFGLWGKNTQLLGSCNDDHAEGCSSVIFAALWESLRAELPQEKAQRLDCHFARLRHIQIDPEGWYLLRIGEMLEVLQRQIGRAQDRPGLVGCGGSPTLRLLGDPDLTCWIRYEFEEESSLNMLLGWISWRNGFSVSHEPPEIVLTFQNRCNWPERPAYFTPKRAADG